MNRFLGMVWALCALSGFARPQAPTPFRFDQTPGPYRVGLKVVLQYDYSRTFKAAIDPLGKPEQGKRARPMQTLVWYPAREGRGKPMAWSDYLELKATETDFEHPHLDPGWKQYNVEGTASVSATAMWSVRDAEPVSGRFPVVIYAPSLNSESWENADLCEYLASYGYLVIASPCMGTNARAMGFNLDYVRTQATDIRFLVGYAQTLPNADTRAIAAGGFSMGGISNLLAAAQDDRIRALFALDGTLRYAPGLVKQAGIQPERMDLPLLYFQKGRFDLEQFDLTEPRWNGPPVLPAWKHGDLTNITMLGFSHMSFGAIFLRNEKELTYFLSELPPGYGPEDAIPGYAAVARYTRAFLDAYLKCDMAALAFLKNSPERNGMPVRTLTVQFRPAKGLPPTLATFRRELGSKGFSKAAIIYAALRKEGLELEEGPLNAYGYQLLRLGAVQEAIEIQRLQVQLFPNSANAYDSLAEAFALAGKTDLAIEACRKSLGLDPENYSARQRLKALGAEF